MLHKIEVHAYETLKMQEGLIKFSWQVRTYIHHSSLVLPTCKAACITKYIKQLCTYSTWSYKQPIMFFEPNNMLREGWNRAITNWQKYHIFLLQYNTTAITPISFLHIHTHSMCPFTARDICYSSDRRKTVLPLLKVASNNDATALWLLINVWSVCTTAMCIQQERMPHGSSALEFWCALELGK